MTSGRWLKSWICSVVSASSLWSQISIGSVIPLSGNGSSHPQTMKVLTGLDNAGGVFHNVWNAKWWSLLLLALSCFGTKGVKNEKIRWSQIWLFLSIGAALFFLNWWMVSAGLLLLYIITSVAGYVCLLLAGVWMSRLLKTT